VSRSGLGRHTTSGRRLSGDTAYTVDFERFTSSVTNPPEQVVVRVMMVLR